MTDLGTRPPIAAPLGNGAATSIRGTSRIVKRRPSLPGGRAVVGGLLITLAMLGTLVAYRSATTQDRTAYAVAARDLPLGTRIVASDIEMVPMNLPRSLANRYAFRSRSTMIGARTTASVTQGELVQSSALLFSKAPAGGVEVAIPVEVARALGGIVQTDEQVDVLVTYGDGPDGYTDTVVSGARIIQRSSEKSSANSNGTSTIVLLGLRSRAEATAVTNAANTGTVTIVRTTGASPSGPTS